MSGFLGVPVGASYHLVFALSSLLTPVAGGLGAAAAIVLFTAAVRLLISPLSLRALRGQAAMTRLTPQVQVLRASHGGQPERFRRELAELYRRERVSPLASIWPLLAQWPFLSVMYLLFRSATVDGGQNRLLSDSVLGVPLGTHWLAGAGLLSLQDGLFLAVFAALAGLCWLSARLARQAAPAPVPTGLAATGPRGERAGQRGRPAAVTGMPGADPAAAAGKAAATLSRVLPYVTVVIAVFAPLAAAVYLLTTVAWTLAERRLFARRAAGDVPVRRTSLTGTVPR